MTNLVEVTIKATDSTASGFAGIKAKAAKAGDDAARAFNDAFKLRADASGSARERLETSGSLGGEDRSLMNKLKGYANTPGGIGILGTGNDTSLVSMLKRQIQSAGESGGLGLLGGSSQSGESLQDTVRQQLTGSGASNVSTTDLIKQVIEGNGPSNYSTKDFIDQVLQGNQPGNVNTQDLIKQVLTGNTPGNVSTEDIIRRVVEGRLPGNIDTTDTIHERVDDSDIKAQGEKDGDTYGKGFASSMMSALSGILGGKGGKGGGGAISGLLTGASEGGGGDESKVAGALNSGGVVGGALPGVAGLSGLQATIVGLGGALVSVLPAITSVGAGLGVIGLGAKELIGSKNVKGQPATQGPLYNQAQSTMSSVSGVIKSGAMAMAKPLEQAFKEISGYFKSIAPEIKSMFADVGPLIQPIVKGFEALMSGALPGFLAMLKAAGPVFQTMGGAFANLGKSLGEMFSDFASDGAGSATVLKSLLEIVNSLLPFIGELGKVMVSALAPAFSAFSGALAAVLPSLDPLLKILGDLAGAVLTDLGSVLGSVGQLLKGLAPSFTALAKAASGVFTALENTGVFASLGNAVEALAAPLSNLINVLVKALLPSLPGIIAAFSEFSKLFTGAVVVAVTATADALADIVKAVPVPVITALVDAFVAWKAAMVGMSVASSVFGVIKGGISGIGTAFTAIKAGFAFITGLPEMIGSLASSIDLVGIATKAWAVAQGALDVVTGAFEAILDSLGIGEVLALIGLLIAALILLITHWKQVSDAVAEAWDAIYSVTKSTVGDIVTFISNGGIQKAAEDVWSGTEADAKAAWNAMKTIVSDGIDAVETALKVGLDLITGNWQGAWKAVKSFAETIWNQLPGPVKNAMSDVANAVSSGMTSAYNAVKNVGGDIVSWVEGLPQKCLQALSGFGDSLNSFAKNAFNLFLEGAESIGTTIVSWVKNFASDVLSAIKSILGISSPSKAMYDVGVNMMLGLEGGIKSKAEAAAATAKAAAKKSAAAAKGGAAGDYSSANLLNVAKYMMAHGYSKAAAAGIASCVAGESGGNPEAMQGGPSGGGGLIQWTPISAYPGLVTGNALKDFNNQLPAILSYNDRQGAGLIAQLNKISNPVSAADFYSQYFERPAVTDSDVVPSVANSIYAQLACGGPTSAGWAVVGEQGRELIKLPGGANVTPHGATEAALGAGGANVHVTLELGPNFVQQTGLTPQQLADIRHEVKVRGGGNVQTAFGRN